MKENNKHKNSKHVVEKKNTPYTQNIGARINQVCARVGGKRRLSQITDISESQLHRIIAGESQAKAETIAAIAAAAGVSLEWLMLGNTTDSELGKPSDSEETNHFHIIPSYAEYNHTADIALRSACIQDYLGAEEDNLVMWLNEGDAMAPTIVDGGKLVVDISRRGEHQDGIYLLDMHGEIVARRLQYNFDKSISILCDNVAYQAQTIPLDQVNELQIIGKIIWAGGKV